MLAPDCDIIRHATSANTYQAPIGPDRERARM
jgi:hypothetical protein